MCIKSIQLLPVKEYKVLSWSFLMSSICYKGCFIFGIRQSFHRINFRNPHDFLRKGFFRIPLCLSINLKCSFLFGMMWRIFFFTFFSLFIVWSINEISPCLFPLRRKVERPGGNFLYFFLSRRKKLSFYNGWVRLLFFSLS